MEPQIGESAQVSLCGFVIEGFRTVSNEYALCIGDASSMLSLSVKQFRRKAQNLLKEKYSEFELAYECNGWAVVIDAISLSVFSSFVNRLSKEDYKPALNLVESLCPDFVSAPPTAKPKGSRLTERKVQKKLARSENGRMEVACPSGVIDIITDKEIIEVKESLKWKTAIGQVLAYGQHYPHLRKRIHLFSGVSPKNKKVICDHCSALEILVTFED